MVTQRSQKYIKKTQVALRDQIATVLKSDPRRFDQTFDDNCHVSMDPSAQPLVWISKWVDYSAKYGFGYQLCDGSVGAMYNDGTRLIMLANTSNLHYILQDLTEFYYTVDNYPEFLKKKMKVMSFFIQYMNEHLMKAEGSVAVDNIHSMSRIPYVYWWYRAEFAVFMQLSNGTVQLNFCDHSKIIMCPLMAAVTYIDVEKNFYTYKFETIKQNGCCFVLQRNLKYAYQMIEIILEDAQFKE